MIYFCSLKKEDSRVFQKQYLTKLEWEIKTKWCSALEAQDVKNGVCEKQDSRIKQEKWDCSEIRLHSLESI